MPSGSEALYGQVYNASAFSSLNGPVSISQIAFRPDATYGSAFSSDVLMQIRMWTTPFGADSLKANAAALGMGVGDHTVVFSYAPKVVTGQILVNEYNDDSNPNLVTGTHYEDVYSQTYTRLQSSFQNAANGTKAFDIAIPLQTAFTYDPTKGNLFMEVSLVDGKGNSIYRYLDAQDTTGDNTSFLKSDGWSSLPQFQHEYTSGLVTQFTYTAVPESSTPYIAGVLVLLPFGVNTYRSLRKKQSA